MTSSNDSTSTTAIFRQWLHNLDEDALHRVLEHRPDTTHPLPPGISSLAARLSLRASIMRALVRLNARELAVLEAASIAGAEIEPVDAPKLVELVRSYSEQNTHDTNRWAPSESELLATIDTLRDYALLFGELAALRIAPDVMDALPAGWQLLPSAWSPAITVTRLLFPCQCALHSAVNLPPFCHCAQWQCHRKSPQHLESRNKAPQQV